MESFEVLKESTYQLGGFKVVKKSSSIETISHLNHVIHFIDLTYINVGIFYHGWVDSRTNDQMKEILTGHFYEIYKKYRCANMLMDCTKMKGSFSGINQWYATVFMPEISRKGLKNHALVNPVEQFAQLSVKDWTRKVIGINNQNFDTLSDALNWLALT